MSAPKADRSGYKRWTDAEIQQLVDQYNSGDSAGVVARTFGVSRNAVIGQINRAKRNGVKVRCCDPTNSYRRGSDGQNRTARRTAPTHSPIPAVQPLAAGDTSGAVSVPVGSSLETSVSQTTPDLEAAPSGPGVLLEEAGPRQCRFPLWPHGAKAGQGDYGLVCGGDAVSGPAGRNYCAHHQTVCTGIKQEKAKIDRIVKATIRGARRAQVA